MEKDDEENYSAGLQANFAGLDYSLDHDQIPKSRIVDNSANNIEMVDYMLNNPPPPSIPSGLYNSMSLDKMSFADVMQFADFGPKLGLNQSKISEEDSGIDPVYFLKFPVLNDRLQDPIMLPTPLSENGEERYDGICIDNKATVVEEDEEEGDEEEARISEDASVRLRLLGGSQKSGSEVKNRRKRPRSVKTSEEVESQRMTHIAVERNRRKQMNEHLRVLRGLMPGTYVQRGDQASIIGGAIEFVRELEQLLQCLESQKRRRIFGSGGEAPRSVADSPSLAIQQSQPQFFPPLPIPNDQIKLLDFDTGLREETAENKSCLADVEVKLLGFDAMIKILSRRRPSQLLKTIAALEDLQLDILHTNITTIEQTVLYSFNVKIAGESRFTAEDVANSVQQIFSFIHANSI